MSEFYEECYSDALKALPDALRYRIDWDGVAHDLECNGDVTTYELDGKVHVFNATI